MTITQIDLSLKQLEFIQSDKRFCLFDGGIGSGKTIAGALWMAVSILRYPGVRAMIVARDVPQLRTATLVEFKKALYMLGLIEDVDYVHNKSNSEFLFHEQGTVVVCVGASNYESAFRGANIGLMWADEIDFYKPEAWERMKGRLRVYPELCRLTSSPKGYNFIYDEFYKKDLDSHQVVNASSYDGLYLSDEFLNSLKNTYAPRLYDQEVLGLRVNLNAGQVYKEFNRDIHVKPCKHLITDGRLLNFFCDYNIAHYHGCYVIFHLGILYYVGEEYLQDKNTIAMAQTVAARYPKNPIMVTGDSTGNNTRNVSSNETNYQIFERYGLNTQRFHNPPVQSRVIAFENALHNRKIVIDPSCVNLIKDLEQVSWKEGSKSNEIDKTSDLSLTHSSDAATYAGWSFLPLRAPTQEATVIDF